MNRRQKPSYPVTTAPLVGIATHPGCARKPMEDAHSFFSIGSAPDQLVSYAAIVADGVTSKAGGAQASQIVVETVQSMLQTDLWITADLLDLRQALDRAIAQAHQRLQKAVEQEPRLKGMSTTFVIAVITGTQLLLAHLGDSRAYLIREQQIHRLTLDHTWVQEVLDRGNMDEAVIKTHPNRHVIQQYLGSQPSVTPDYQIVVPHTYYKGAAGRALTTSLTLCAGDAILLCSDGLNGTISDAEMLSMIQQQASPRLIAQKLVNLAIRRKEPDNITALYLVWQNQEERISVGRKRLVSILLTVLILLAGWLGIQLWQSSTDNRCCAISLSQTVASAWFTPTAEEQKVSEKAISSSQAPSRPLPIPPKLIATATPSDWGNSIQRKPPAVLLTPTSTLRARSINTPAQLPMITPMMTPTLIVTSTQNLVPTITRPITSVSSLTTVLGPSDQSLVEITFPPCDYTGSGKQYFAWVTNHALAANQAYEVIFWKAGQDPLTTGIGIKDPTRLLADTVDLEVVSHVLGAALPHGDYLWAILLVNREPYIRLQILSKECRFRLQ